MSTPLTGIDLDQYRTQAKDLYKRAKAGAPGAIDRIRAHHPEAAAIIAGAKFQLVDAQLVLAREYGFPSWNKFKDYVLFRNAVDALDDGDTTRLTSLLDGHPSLISYRCHIGEWYESGYFSGAGLLQHVAGNPIRHPLSSNILDIARILLDHGADPNSEPSTIELLLTSLQASRAGVALPLVDLLRQAGATDAVDLENPDTLNDPIWNVGIETARELVRRGARMDLPQAAALGDIEEMKGMVERGGATPEKMEIALMFAVVQNQLEAVRFLVDHGARGDVLLWISPRWGGGATALHQAANRGHFDIVRFLVEHGARATALDERWNGTAIGWAEHGGHADIAAYLREHAV